MIPFDWNRDQIDWPRVLAGALAVVLVGALGVVAATSTAAFDLHNPSWEGATDLRQQFEDDPTTEQAFITEPSQYDELDPNGTVAFVVAPEDGSDAAESRSFVENGGRLVIFENFEPGGNELAATVGATARVDGRLLTDDRQHYQAPTMPIAPTVTNHSLTTGVDQLTLNHATAVNPGNATVLVTTSGAAYLDDGGGLETADSLAAYPVATVEPVGDGQVVVVGDPSLTINTMLAQPDNEAFVRALTADADVVAFDLSRGGGTPPLITALLAIRGTPLLQVTLGAVGIGLAVAVSNGSLRHATVLIRRRLPWPWRSTTTSLDNPGLTDAERAAVLRQQHPDWDEDRIERITTAINTDPHRGDNE